MRPQPQIGQYSVGPTARLLEGQTGTANITIANSGKQDRGAG